MTHVLVRHCGLIMNAALDYRFYTIYKTKVTSLNYFFTKQLPVHAQVRCKQYLEYEKSVVFVSLWQCNISCIN